MDKNIESNDNANVENLNNNNKENKIESDYSDISINENNV